MSGPGVIKLFLSVLCLGIPRFLLPLILCLLQSTRTAISSFQTGEEVKNFPYLDLIATFVEVRAWQENTVITIVLCP